MSYCINPNCGNPNPIQNINHEHCQTCGADLTLHDLYRVIRQIDDNNYLTTYQIYEHHQPQNRLKTLKILNPKYNHTPMGVVFQQEIETLIALRKINYTSIPLIDDNFYYQTPDNITLHCVIMEENLEFYPQLYLEKWLLSPKIFNEKEILTCLKQLSCLFLALPHKKITNSYLIALGLVLIFLITRKEIATMYEGNLLKWREHLTCEISVLLLDFLDDLIKPKTEETCNPDWLSEQIEEIENPKKNNWWWLIGLLILLWTGTLAGLIYFNRCQIYPNWCNRIAEKPQVDKEKDVVYFPYEPGADSQGKTAEFNLVILSASYRWKIASSDAVQLPNQNKFINLSNLKSKLEQDGILEVMENPARIIAVGTASCEGELTQEENRAFQRAYNIQENLAKKIFTVKDFRILNLGQNKTSDCVPNPEITSFQRSIIIIGVKKEAKGVILEEALRDRLSGKIAGLNLEEYSRGTPEKFKLIPND
jgi:eukaryotic-like serine/threonine-protein kinase